MPIEIQDLVIAVKIAPSDTEADFARRQRDKNNIKQAEVTLRPLFTEADMPEVLRRKDDR